MKNTFQPDFKLHCRYCNAVLDRDSLRGRGALYCNDDCRRAWRNGYERRMQQEHRDKVAARLERLAELESAIERGDLVSAQTH